MCMPILVVDPVFLIVLLSCVCIAEASFVGVEPQNVNVLVAEFVKPIFPVRVKAVLSRIQLFN